MNKNGFLQIKKLFVTYDKKDVLQEVDFAIKLNEKVLLIGPNGAGKSTLLKTIAGILHAKEGKIIFQGKDITQFPTATRVKAGIVYLKQERDIFPSLTVRENLEMAGFYLDKVPFEDKLEEILNYFPILKDKLDKRAGLLSGGERRALGIGMVFIKEPKLLLLDEPTAGLAPSAASEILEQINRAQQKRNMTTIVVEHNLHLLMETVSRVLIMNQGNIVLDEPSPQKLIENPEILEKYFFGQVKNFNQK